MARGGRQEAAYRPVRRAQYRRGGVPRLGAARAAQPQQEQYGGRVPRAAGEGGAAQPRRVCSGGQIAPKAVEQRRGIPRWAVCYPGRRTSPGGAYYPGWACASPGRCASAPAGAYQLWRFVPRARGAYFPGRGVLPGTRAYYPGRGRTTRARGAYYPSAGRVLPGRGAYYPGGRVLPGRGVLPGARTTRARGAYYPGGAYCPGGARTSPGRRYGGSAQNTCVFGAACVGFSPPDTPSGYPRAAYPGAFGFSPMYRRKAFFPRRLVLFGQTVQKYVVLFIGIYFPPPQSDECVAAIKRRRRGREKPPGEGGNR